jgi:enoyl-CoA hydratase/carnithine racemase
MLTSIRERDRERILTVQIDEETIDGEVVGTLASAVSDMERAGIENLVLRFGGDPHAVSASFPSWRPGPGRGDIRFFAHWEETVARISKLKAKTFAAYDGVVGAAALHVGLVTDLRLASSDARLALSSVADGPFPGMAAYWLPKFVGLGNARRMLLLGGDLPARQAAQFGLVDMVEDTVEQAVEGALTATRRVSAETAYFTRRILDDCFLLEHSAAAELTKAARFKLGMSEPQPMNATAGISAGRNHR